jgi:hypothetical protein
VITSKAAKGYRRRRFLVIAAMAFSVFAPAQSAKKISRSGGAKEKPDWGLAPSAYRCAGPRWKVQTGPAAESHADLHA